MNVDARGKLWVLFAGTSEACLRQPLKLREGDIGQRLGSGTGISSRHVGDAVVDDVFFDESGMVVRGRP